MDNYVGRKVESKTALKSCNSYLNKLVDENLSGHHQSYCSCHRESGEKLTHDFSSFSIKDNLSEDSQLALFNGTDCKRKLHLKKNLHVQSATEVEFYREFLW